ncbi:hypothetical protein GQX74_015360 [Glossina fuscipes]|nr:hypothetical protein GQX74_015360 [Glossina fuscipes]
MSYYEGNKIRNVMKYYSTCEVAHVSVVCPFIITCNYLCSPTIFVTTPSILYAYNKEFYHEAVAERPLKARLKFCINKLLALNTYTIFNRKHCRSLKFERHCFKSFKRLKFH